MDNINTIVNTLKQQNVAAGCFITNYEGAQIKFEKYSSKLKNIKNFCSRGNHPSGFFLTENYSKEKIYMKH